MTSKNSMKKVKGRPAKGSKKGVSEQGGKIGLPEVDGAFSGMVEKKMGKMKGGKKGAAKPKAMKAGAVKAPFKGGKKKKGY